MQKFDEWWSSVYSDKPKAIYRQCFDNGYDKGYDDGLASVSLVRWIIVAIVIVTCVFALSGCEDHYRYPCQNPDNFAKPECQRPKCLFTQMCPDYLVAPILKDQINAQPSQTTSEAAPNR